jgi:translation initiation factor 2 subunit 1
MTLVLGSEWPARDELVVAVIDDIVDHGAYVTLESHGGKKGYLPISEISQGWVTDIRKFVNPGQRVVLRAIRVNPVKGHIDLSLKRVAPSERNSILRAWKRRKRFLKTIEGVFDSLKIPKENRSEIVSKFLSRPDPLTILEKAASDGEVALDGLGLDPSIIPQIVEYSKKIVKLKEYSDTFKFSLSTVQRGGAERIKRVLKTIEKFLNEKGVKAKVYVVAAPKYAVEITSDRPKLVNSIIKDLPSKVKELAEQEMLVLSLEEQKQ